ncbi:Histone-lysine N-methyltransferase, H3 lysine-36 and H4 lysine-20specific [Zea mays]|uniref:Histone-lysine N-methyltransferase, H3 lysine-36 and H4 lysine-20specific n=1 Tax=Zea mays TaxID=4577 RepID=A0A1D6I1R7_MAIZE|nr:Histone-lysine N-methyltransferase, H3 lysine-36 and H4 lysine-20specific [Zea mays]
MVRMSSSSSASGVNLTEQIENVFDQLISKIEQADPDFDPRPFLKQLNVLGRYEPIKRRMCLNVIWFFFVIESEIKLFFLASELRKRMEILLYQDEFEFVPFYGHVHIFIALNSTKMYISLRDTLKIMAFLVTVSLLLVHQLCVAETAIVENLEYETHTNFMLFSCCSSQCECDIACTNKSFQHRPLTKTKLIKVRSLL